MVGRGLRQGRGEPRFYGAVSCRRCTSPTTSARPTTMSVACSRARRGRPDHGDRAGCWRPAADGLGRAGVRAGRRARRLLGHVAIKNDQWREPPIGEAMAIVRGPDAYVTPAGTRRSASTAGSSRPGTTSSPTSTAGSSSTTTRLVRANVRRLADGTRPPDGAVGGRRRAGRRTWPGSAGDRRRRARHRPHRGQGRCRPSRSRRDGSRGGGARDDHGRDRRVRPVTAR